MHILFIDAYCICFAYCIYFVFSVNILDYMNIRALAVFIFHFDCVLTRNLK